MEKLITFDYKGKTYQLGFTRRTVAEMQRNGFVVNDAQQKPAVVLPDLFAGAFLAHERMTKRAVINEIFDSITDKEGLFNKLIELYVDPITDMMEDPKDTKNAVKWTANW